MQNKVLGVWHWSKSIFILIPDQGNCLSSSPWLGLCLLEVDGLFSGHLTTAALQIHFCPYNQGLSSFEWILERSWKYKISINLWDFQGNSDSELISWILYSFTGESPHFSYWKDSGILLVPILTTHSNDTKTFKVYREKKKCSLQYLSNP